VEQDGRSLVIGARGGRGELRYAFNAAFGPQASQADVYATVQPSISLITSGISATIMAYGQTGSGKSHTMLGPEVTELTSLNSSQLALHKMRDIRAMHCH
jgi:Kinesin motor domain